MAVQIFCLQGAASQSVEEKEGMRGATVKPAVDELKSCKDPVQDEKELC